MSKKKVLLIDPPGKYPQVLNIGLGWLSANLVDAACVRVMGLANIPVTLNQAQETLYKNVSRDTPDIVGFNIHCNTYQTVFSMIKNLRTYFKGIIAIGGPHTIYEKKAILEKIPQADIVVVGEAEYSFSQICQRDFGDYSDLEGVIYRQNNVIVENPVKSLKKEFGTLRYPDYRLFGIKKIYCAYPISTSRGCPFSCCFCNPFMGGKIWRARQLDDVFEELSFAKTTFDIKSFIMVEPVFNIKPERVIEFCEGLLKRNIKLPWYSSSGLRADSITAETVKIMKKAGCTHIKIGVETLVPEIFKHVNKGETIEDIKRAAQIVKLEKMPLHGSFIIGLPYDTLSTVRLNYKLSRKLGFDFTEWSLLFPYPGTKAYEWMEQNGNIYHSIETAHQSPLDLMDQDLKKRAIVNVACDTVQFPKNERAKAFWEINTKSGNYVFSIYDSDRQKAMIIFKAILKYDPLRFFWHLCHIVKLLKKRALTMKEGGVRVDFAENAF